MEEERELPGACLAGNLGDLGAIAGVAAILAYLPLERTMSWLKLDAAYFQNPAMIRAGWDGKIVFLALISMAKLHGCWGGLIAKDDCTPEVLRAHLGAPESRHSDEQLRHGLASCLRVGLIEEPEDNPNHYRVRAWSKHQIDPTAAKRAKKYRDSKRKRHGDVTQRHSDVPLRHGNHGDPLSRMSSTSPPETPKTSGTTHPLTPSEEGADFASLSEPEPEAGTAARKNRPRDFDHGWIMDTDTMRAAVIAWADKEASMSRDPAAWREPAASIRRDIREKRPYPDDRVAKDFAKIRAKDERGLGHCVRKIITANRKAKAEEAST